MAGLSLRSRSLLSFMSRQSRPDIAACGLDPDDDGAGAPALDGAAVFEPVVVVGGGDGQQQAQGSAGQYAELKRPADHVGLGLGAQLGADPLLGHVQAGLVEAARLLNATAGFSLAMQQQDGELRFCQATSRCGDDLIADDHVACP